MNELIRMAFEDTADPLWMAPGTRRFAQEYSGPVGAAQDVPYGGWPVQADALDYSGMAPGIGDVTGPMADVRMYMRDPEQLTPGNVGMSLFGLAPGIPSVAPVMAGIAAPIGGNLGMLGRKLPQVGNSLRDMVANAGYRIGSAPGVYTHDIGNYGAVRSRKRHLQNHGAETRHGRARLASSYVVPRERTLGIKRMDPACGPAAVSGPTAASVGTPSSCSGTPFPVPSPGAGFLFCSPLGAAYSHVSIHSTDSQPRRGCSPGRRRGSARGGDL